MAKKAPIPKAGSKVKRAPLFKGQDKSLASAKPERAGGWPGAGPKLAKTATNQNYGGLGAGKSGGGKKK